MNIKKIAIYGILGLLAIIVLSGSLFIVNEKQQVVITQFGEPIRTIKEPGLNAKLPFVQTIHYFDKRFLEWDGDRSQVPTKSKKFIFVDTYARWRITDPLQFYNRLGTERMAQSRLDDIIDGQTRDLIASNELEEVVRNSNRDPVKRGKISELVKDSLPDIKVGRDSIQNMIQRSTNQTAQDLGIEVLDVRFKQINYVKKVREKVYSRMRSERHRIAEKFRSEGRGRASEINGEKERELNKIQSEAYETAQKIKGKADAKAANVYASAYDKSPRARELYEFMKSMETYKKTFNKETSVILSTDSDFYKYLEDMN